MLVPLPEGINPVVVASASDNIPDGWRAVGPQLAADPGAEVLVVGGDAGSNSIGLYAAGLAVALGAVRVVYLDQSAQRLQIAEKFGAEVMDGPPQRRVGSFPVTVDASGDAESLACAINSTASDGTCTSTSVYLQDPTVPMFAMYARSCTLHTGRAHVRIAIPAVLDAVAAGFDPSIVTSEVVPVADAVEALAHPPLKLVIDCTSCRIRNLPVPPPAGSTKRLNSEETQPFSGANFTSPVSGQSLSPLTITPDSPDKPLHAFVPSARASCSPPALPIVPNRRPDGHDSTAPANGGPQPGLRANCPVKIESKSPYPTDVVAEDPFVVIAAGRAPFHAARLVELAVAGLRAAQLRSRSGSGSVCGCIPVRSNARSTGAGQTTGARKVPDRTAVGDLRSTFQGLLNLALTRGRVMSHQSGLGPNTRAAIDVVALEHPDAEADCITAASDAFEREHG